MEKPEQESERNDITRKVEEIANFFSIFNRIITMGNNYIPVPLVFVEEKGLRSISLIKCLLEIPSSSSYSDN